MKVSAVQQVERSFGAWVQQRLKALLAEPDAPSQSIGTRPRFVPHLAGGTVGRMRIATAGIALIMLAGCATTGADVRSLRAPVQRVVHEQVFREHSGGFQVGGEHFGAGIKLGAEPIASDDPLIKGTPSRAARTDLHWARTFWRFEPRAGASTSIPVGLASITLGFNASTKIEAEMLAPYRIAVSDLQNLVLPVTLDAPMTPGQEAVFGGRGTVSATAGGRVGHQLASLLGDRITVGVSAGASINIGKEAWINVRVLELPGDLRLVALTKGQEQHRGVSADASLGWSSTFAHGIAADQLNAWLGANFNAKLDFGKGEQVVGTFLFDRRSSDPDVHAAYDSLMNLGAAGAEGIAERNGGLDAHGRPLDGIAYADFAKDYATRTGSVDARIGKLELIKRINNSAAEHGSLTSTFGERLEYWTGSQHRAGAGLFTSIWSGHRELDRELSITMNAKGQRSSYYRLAWETKRDRVTTAQDVLNIATLAHRLGALAGHENVLKDLHFLESFHSTNRALEVYFVDLEKLGAELAQRGDPRQLLTAAFGRAYQDSDIDNLRDPNRGQVPWLDGTLDPSFVAFYSGPHDQDRIEQYKLLTGRSLSADAAAYHQMQGILQLLADLRDLPTPKEKIERFRIASLGSDFWVPLIAIADAAGPDATLVNRLELTGNGKDERHFMFASEGRVADPRAMVAQILGGLERGDTAVRN